MTFVKRRNRLTTHFSESIPVAKQRITVLEQIFRMTLRYRSIKLPTFYPSTLSDIKFSNTDLTTTGTV